MTAIAGERLSLNWFRVGAWSGSFAVHALVVPVTLGSDVLGLVGLHTTRTPREWLDDEVSFLQAIAGQIAIGAAEQILLVHWRSLALPPLFISLFAMNQLLKRRRAKGAR